MDPVNRQMMWQRVDREKFRNAGAGQAPPAQEFSAGQPDVQLPPANGRELPVPGPRVWTRLAFDGAVQVDGLDDSEIAVLEEAWARCQPADSAIPIGADNRLERGRDLWPVFHERLVHRMTAAAIDSGRGHVLMFHAAALASTATGATMVLAAPSGTGKTTATRVLGRHLGYVTDETAAVSADGSMVPFPKPLSALGTAGLRPKTQISPDEIGLLHPDAKPRLARIALLDRDRKGSLTGAHWEPLTLHEALEVLVPQTSSLSFLDRGLVRLCEALDNCGGALRLRYAEAEQLLPLVLDLLDGATGTGAEGKPHWRPLPLDTATEPAPVAGMVRRIRPDDVVELEPALGDVRPTPADIAILHAERLTILGGLGSTLWTALAKWHSREELVSAAVEAHGDHLDAAILVDRTLAGLSERGLIQLS